MNIIQELKQLQKDRKNIGIDLTLWSLINILIKYLKSKKEVEKNE